MRSRSLLHAMRADNRALACVGLVVTVVLFALNLQRGLALRQEAGLYDPVYRWRQTLIVALSQMREHPPGGYLGFKSIQDVFVKGGFAVLADETGGLPPDMARIEKLQRDGHYLDGLIREALTVPIDRTAPAVLIRGNELGWSDFVYWSFELFGPHISSLFYFYFFLLACSAAIFFATFRRSPTSLFVLSLFLIAHYLIIGYASDITILESITNSRAYSAPALLPGLYLLLLMLRREPATRQNVVSAFFQAALLAFYVFCRLEAAWIPLTLAAIGAPTFPYRKARNWLRERKGSLRQALQHAWVTAAVAVTLIGLMGYDHFAPARQYREDTGTHVFWHELYLATFSALGHSYPEAMRYYLHGQDPDGDGMAYMAALKYLRDHDDGRSPVAYVNDGVISMDIMRDLGAYDRIIRGIFVDFVVHHPVMFLTSFYDKLWIEISQMRPYPRSIERGSLPLALELSGIVALLFLGVFLPQVDMQGCLIFGGGAVAFAIGALISVFVEPSTLLCGSLLVYRMLCLLILTAVPVVCVRFLLEQGRAIASRRGAN